MTQWDDFAFNEGWAAFFNGNSIEDNPYTDPFLHDSWEEGWIAASNQVTRTF